MIKRFSLLALSALLVTSLNSCAVVGGLVGAITRLPGSLLGGLTDATETPEATVEPTLENALAPETMSVVVTPVSTVE